MAGIGTYYDFNCGNKSNPGVGCNAYGKPLCRTCTFNKTHTKSHSICPNIPCLNKTKTVADNASDDQCKLKHSDQKSCDADTTTGGGCTWCKCSPRRPCNPV